MLDFLNLKYEAELVVWFCILGGALAGMGFGLLSVNGKGWKDKLWTVLAWLFIGLAVIAGGLACVAGFMLLITFKWGHLFKALLCGQKRELLNDLDLVHFHRYRFPVIESDFGHDDLLMILYNTSLKDHVRLIK